LHDSYTRGENSSRSTSRGSERNRSYPPAVRSPPFGENQGAAVTAWGRFLTSSQTTLAMASATTKRLLATNPGLLRESQGLKRLSQKKGRSIQPLLYCNIKHRSRKGFITVFGVFTEVVHQGKGVKGKEVRAIVVLLMRFWVTSAVR